ncbi:MAG: hypothetical protein NT049_06475 [Planctomycetota bacterium]|nr:hypothetical protein [Planctomycetota bacterium]
MARLTLAAVIWAILATSCSAAPVPAEDIISFDPVRTEVRQLEGHWKVVCGETWLMDFGDREAQARLALRIVRHYGLNQQCYVGSPTRVLSYYLISGRPPEGPCEGEDAIAFDPARAEVRQIGGHWKIVQGDLWLIDFGREIDARQSLAMIQRYQFNFMCFVGRPDPRMTYFRRGGPAAAPAPATPPAGATARLRVTVVEGARAPAVRPVVTVRHAEDASVPSVSLNENPAEFPVRPGPYLVSAHVGSSPETPQHRVTVAPTGVTEFTLNTATGTLELTLTAGGRPFPRGPVIQLRAGSAIVAAVSESPARFQAAAGTYLVRVQLDGGQVFEIADVSIPAGEVVRRTVEVPSGRMIVTVTGGGYAPGSGRFPMVEVRQGERMVTALADNPARFYMLAGEYTVGVREGDRLVAPRTVTLRAGDEQAVSITIAP